MLLTLNDLFLLGLEFEFGYTISNTYGWQHGHDWNAVVITDSEGVQVGRMKFKDGNLYTWKCYKPEYVRELCETDLIFIRLQRYLHDGVVISKPLYQDLVVRAREQQQTDLLTKLTWDRAHPKMRWVKQKDGSFEYKNTRKSRLGGRNPRNVLRRLVMNIEEK